MGKFKHHHLDAVIIGAGPSGLILAKRLAQTKATFKVYEKHHDVGGIWDINAKGSPMYDSAHFISSRTLSGFDDFPMPEDYPDYPNHEQLLAYIKSYADAFDLKKHIQFNTTVTRAAQDKKKKWHVFFADGSCVITNYLICANGVTWEANKVHWRGQETFTGDIRHSQTYRSTSEFTNKRVLVVGAGNSGVDIACDASFAAKQAYLSVRRGYHFLPKHIMGKPADVFAKESPKLPFAIEQQVFGLLLRMLNGKMAQYGLPEPDHKVFQTHPIMNTQILHYLAHGDCIAKADIDHFDHDKVVFKDGSHEQIDLVITATGYQHAVPFLPKNTIAYKNGRPDLYLNMFSRQHHNLAVLGFIEFASAAYSNFDKMAALIVHDVLHQPKKLAKKKRKHRPDLTGGHQYLGTARNANYVDLDTYLKTLAKLKKQLSIR